MGYCSCTTVPTVPLTGSGTGCTVNVTVSNEVVTAVTINRTGSGYQVGDILTVDNSDVKVTRGSGLEFMLNLSVLILFAN